MTKSHIVFPATGLVAFVVYAATLAPTITWRNSGVDGGDLATAVAVGGVPHPPGYPTYLVLAELFKLLPVGDLAYRLNLLSAVSAAGAVAIIALVIYHTLSTSAPDQQAAPEAEPERSQTLRWLCAISAALTLAFAGMFWSQAVITEVYSLNALLAAGLLYGALRVKPANERWAIPALAGLFGLSLGNHLTIVFWLPLLIWVLPVRWRWQLGVGAVLAGGAGLLLYLIIPLRAANSPPVNWGLATSWPNFLWLVRADLYRHYLFAIPWSLAPDRAVAELRLLNEAFIWWGLPVGLLGFQQLLRFKRRLAFGSLAVFWLISSYSIGYNTADSYVLLLPALLIVSLWVGWGLFELSQLLPEFIPRPFKGRYFSGVGLLLLPCLSLWLNFADQNIRQDNEAYDFAQRTLQLVEPEGLIITDDDPHTFSLWYGRYALGWRPDVAIINLNLLPYPWYRQSLRQTHAQLVLVDQANRPITTPAALIEQNLPYAPVYLAIIPPLPELKEYRLEPVQQLQQVVNPAKDSGQALLRSREKTRFH